MNVIRRSLILGLCLLSCACAVAADSPTTTVAVVDFSVPADASNTWAWARSGMADLLQIELDQRGLVTLDRSFIQAVLSERRMAVGGLTSSDCKSIATLLGAKYLVTGKVTPLEGGKCRLEASAFSVETIETVATGVGEGVLPKELPVLLQKVADDLAAGLRKGQAAVAPVKPTGHVPNAEALIAYYKGLNAYADGQPEAAVAWFINAAGLDKQFAAPTVWEIKAYKPIGMEDHVRIREEETVPLMKTLGLSTGTTTNPVQPGAIKTVAVLAPMVTSSGPSALGIDPASVVTALKQAVVATKKARLFESENMPEAVAEHDRTLNPLFSRRDGLRYGRWATADALLLCRVESMPSKRTVLHLSLRDPLTSSAVAECSDTVGADELPARANSLTGQLIADWAAGRSAHASGSSGAISPESPRVVHLPQSPASVRSLSADAVSAGREIARKMVVILPPEVGGDGNRLNPLRIDASSIEMVLRQVLTGDMNPKVLDLEDSPTNTSTRASSSPEPMGDFGGIAMVTVLNKWRQKGVKGVDAFLRCSLRRGTDQTVGLKLAFCEPQTLNEMVSGSDMATIDNAESKIKSLAEHLIDDWLQGRRGRQDALDPKESGIGMTQSEVNGLPEALRPLVLALRGVRSSPDSSNAHRALADAFAGLDRRRQFAMEVEKTLDALDVRTSDAPHTLGSICEWLSGITGSWRFADPDGAGVSANTRRPKLNAALQKIDPKKFQRPAALLFATFPDDLDAMSFRNNLAVDAHREMEWALALHHAHKARDPMVSYLSSTKKNCRNTIVALTINLYYTEVDSLASLGRFEEAESLLHDAQVLIARNPLIGPRNLQRSQVMGRGDWRTIGGRDYYDPLLVVTASDLARRRVAATGGAVQATSVAATGGTVQVNPGRRAKDLLDSMDKKVDLSDAESIAQRVLNDWSCVTQLAAIGETVTNDEKEAATVVACVEQAVRRYGDVVARFPSRAGGTKEKALIPRVTAMLLESEGIPAFKGAEKLPLEKLQSIADRIIDLHECAGVGEQAIDAVRPLLAPSSSPFLGFNLIPRLCMPASECGRYVKALIARCPRGEADVPNAVWMRLAESEQGERRYREALADYARGFKCGAPTNHYIGLSVSLMNVALDEEAEHVKDGMARLCAEYRVPEFVPHWRHWLNIGRERQKVGSYLQAAVCYRQALDAMVPPDPNCPSPIAHRCKINAVGGHRIRTHTKMPWGEVGVVVVVNCFQANPGDYDAATCDVMTLFLAQCVAQCGGTDDLTAALRALVRKYGRASARFVTSVTEDGWHSLEDIAVGIEANRLLERLHQQAEPVHEAGATNAVGKARQGK